MLNKLKERMEQARDAAENAVSSTLLKNKVEDSIQEFRYNICQNCEKLYKPTDTCKVCGCFMKIKTWMPKQACPLSKWPAVQAKSNSQ